MVELVAVDYGSRLWASRNGVPEDAYQPRVPGKRVGTTRYANDFIGLVEIFFEEGLDVVTEAPTMGSFKQRAREDDMIALLEQYSERRLLTIGSRAAQNEYRRRHGDLGERDGVGKWNKHLPDSTAAALIWQLAARDGAKIWKPRNPRLVAQHHDPLRPESKKLVQLRNDSYPRDRMDVEVYAFLPDFQDLTPEQKTVLGDGIGGYAPDRAAAFVISLTEPESVTREGWERVLGACRDGRGNIYRQMLIVGKPRASYEHKMHFTGVKLTDARRALRQLRSTVLDRLSMSDPA